ncbi:hypothetical protein ACFL5Z_14540, partial [Planctomycetota bacterium]
PHRRLSRPSRFCLRNGPDRSLTATIRHYAIRAEDSAFAEETYSAMVQIAGQNVSGISMDQRRQMLQTVLEKSRNEGTKRRARRILGRIR